MTEYNTIDYFFNLLSVVIIFWPFYQLSSSRNIRKGLLLVMGWICLWSIAPRFLVFYGFYWLLIYLFIKVIETKKHSKTLFVISLTIATFSMFFWKLNAEIFLKYVNFYPHYFLWNFVRPIGEIDLTKNILFPLGLSFSTFRAVDILVKCKIGFIDKPLSFIDFWTYAFFPFVQAVGPICEIQEIDDLPKKKVSRKDLLLGFFLIIGGLAKLYLFAKPLANSSNIFLYFNDYRPIEIWFYLFQYVIYLYLNFAGFSDLAVGFSSLFGVRIKGNFNFPFLQSNIQNFWNNWHMSLSSFAQRNIYVPLGGYRKNRQYFALFITMMFIAIWHEISFSFLLFGIYHSLGLITHRVFSSSIFRARWKENLSTLYMFSSIIVTFLFVIFSFPLIALCDDSIIPFYIKLLGL